MFIAVLLLFFSAAAWGEDGVGLEATGGVFRTTFESLSLPADEDMGLAGGMFLYDANDWFSIGPGFYDALTGKYGGFITLGLAGELKKEINDRFFLNAGLFVGAGGGGGGGFELSGGGLMLRPHAGITFSLDEWADIGIGISHIEFPDGSISSTQPYVGIDLPFEMLMERGWRDTSRYSGPTAVQIPSSLREFSLLYRRYFVPSNVQPEPIGLVGARWDNTIGRHAFLMIESMGAMQGENNGFMQILLGGGFRFSLARRTYLKLSAGAGGGGGGGVDTGGGFLINGELAVQQYLTDSLYLTASGGYIDAPDGSFEAVTAGLQIGCSYEAPDVSKGTYDPAALSGYERNMFRIRTVHQTYLKNDNDDWRLHHNNENVDNLGLQLDYFPSRAVYLTGQGLAAYGRGNAGAYMKGLLGAGLHYPLGSTPVFFDLEALAGAAGGGGVAVGDGFVWQVNTGLGIDLTDTFSLQATVGYINAPGDDFEATVVGAAVGYRFVMFSKPQI